MVLGILWQNVILTSKESAWRDKTKRTEEKQRMKSKHRTDFEEAECLVRYPNLIGLIVCFHFPADYRLFSNYGWQRIPF